jgi:hypothetical protein
MTEFSSYCNVKQHEYTLDVSIMAGPVSSTKSCAVAPRFRVAGSDSPQIMPLQLCCVPIENSGPPVQPPTPSTPGPRAVRSRFPTSHRLIIGSAQPARPRKRRTPTLSSPASLFNRRGRRTRGLVRLPAQRLLGNYQPTRPSVSSCGSS